MKLRPKSVHPEGEASRPDKSEIFAPIEVETFDGKVTVEWEPQASVTPLGQLPFFIQYLKLGQRFDPWVEDCPLHYESNNAPQKRDVLGSLLLSILSGHRRYAHLGALANDTVNTQLLGMNKVVSDDSARRALKKVEEEAGKQWLAGHLFDSYFPLLTTPWILDVDVTIKPLYGHQEDAKVGYNPHKPGRPSHTYHTYMMGNLRLVLDVEVQAGNKGNASHTLPGLMALLSRLPDGSQPAFIRGDCDWGSEPVMCQLEEQGYDYLFKVRKSKQVKALIHQEHGKGQWTRCREGWEAKTSQLTLTGWSQTRKVVLVRRQLRKESELVLEHPQKGQQHLAFIDGPEDLKLYEYSVLVTNLDTDVVGIVQHYRDRADCENNFDELKNQWGWGGFTTRKVTPCRHMARMIALVYNWWSLFVRLANPTEHREAITSRPLLLSSVGRLTTSGRSKKITITSHHNRRAQMQQAYQRIGEFFNQLKRIAPQLSRMECWSRILAKAMEAFRLKTDENAQGLLSAPT